MTENQYQMQKGFNYALEHAGIVAILDYSGSGFKYALNHFLAQSGKVMASCGNIQFTGNRNISIEVKKDTHHIKFSNLDYTKSDMVDLIYKIHERSKGLLNEKKILIAFDNFERLNTVARLSRAISILKNIKFKCGIVLRINREGLDKLFGLDEDLSIEISALISKRIVLTKNTPNDIINLCRSHGVRNQSIIEEVSQKTLNFSVAMQKIKDQIKNYPPGQLEIIF